MEIKKIIAKKEVEVIGGEPKIFRYWDENDKKSIDILSCVEKPYIGVISYATIGLSEYDIGMSSENKRLRIELLGVCYEEEELFANILSTVAFEIMDRGNCGYGQIISDVISQYNYDCDMKHIYLMNPFLWDGFKTIEFEDRKIAWLLAIPISSQEKAYAMANGWDALETKLEEADIDIFNLKRESIL